MAALTFNAVFEHAGDRWVYVHVPELPEVHTQGEDPDEARKMVRDSIELVLEERRARVGADPRARLGDRRAG
jgi:predicted RNase H-like HicB family nuclease